MYLIICLKIKLDYNNFSKYDKYINPLDELETIDSEDDHDDLVDDETKFLDDLANPYGPVEVDDEKETLNDPSNPYGPVQVDKDKTSSVGSEIVMKKESNDQDEDKVKSKKKPKFVFKSSRLGFTSRDKNKFQKFMERFREAQTENKLDKVEANDLSNKETKSANLEKFLNQLEMS